MHRPLAAKVHLEDRSQLMYLLVVAADIRGGIEAVEHFDTETFAAAQSIGELRAGCQQNAGRGAGSKRASQRHVSAYLPALGEISLHGPQQPNLVRRLVADFDIKTQRSIPAVLLILT